MKSIRNIIKEHLDPYPKIGDYLYAHTDMFTHIKELKRVITMGNIYPILGISVSHNYIVILNNSKNVFTLPVPTVEINFTVVPKEELLNVDDAFDKLYESVKGIPDDLKLIFDPPIYNSHDFKNVMRVFNLKYPNLKWRGGEDCLGYNPFETDDIEEEDAVSHIQIEYSKLGYISTSDSEFEDSKKSKNGWKWVEKNDTDFDMTSRLFDSLNESKEDEVENHDFLRDINLVGMEFRYDKEIYCILKNVDEDGVLIITNPYYGTGSVLDGNEFIKYELETLIDALNRGGHAKLVLDDINLDNLYESEEEVNNYTVEEGDIFQLRDYDQRLIKVVSIICGGEQGEKMHSTENWGNVTVNNTGCIVNFIVSNDNGETWNEPESNFPIDVAWVHHLLKDGYWKLFLKNENLFDKLNESNELKYPIDKGTALYCHRGMQPIYTAGKYYTVTAIHYQTEDYPYDTINIGDNFGHGGSFTIQKDGQDLNYETWFTLGDSTFDTAKAFDSLYESEEDEFEWVQDIVKNINDYTSVKWIKTTDGKRFDYFEVVGDKDTFWHIFSGWGNWFLVTGLESVNGELCYLTKLKYDEKDHHGHVGGTVYYTPVVDYSENEVSFQERRPS